MTREELLKRMVLKEARPNPDRASTVNRRTRGDNHIEAPEPHPAEYFDDFFDYEKEFTEFTPSRDTVSNDIDQFTDAQHYTPPVIEDTKEDDSSFVIMEKITTQTPKVNNIITKDDSLNDAEDLPFEFVRCTFLKEDGEQCKKQAKKGQDYCGIHRKYIEKNS